MQGAGPRHRRDGRRADPDALAATTCRRCRASVGQHLGSTATTSPPSSTTPAKVRSVLGLPGYGDFYKGKPITTMTYDFWVGRRAHRFDGTRFTLQEIFLSSLTNFLYDDGRAPERRPVVVGAAEEAGDRQLGQPHRAAGDGRGHQRRRVLRRAAAGRRDPAQRRPGGGRHCSPTSSPSSRIAVREAADAAMKRIAERRGLGRFMKLTETAGRLRVAPARRLPDGRVAGPRRDRRRRRACSATRACTASTRRSSRRSLGVNPSLTIAAVAERCAEALVHRGADLGLPGRVRPGSAVILGDRGWSASALERARAGRPPQPRSQAAPQAPALTESPAREAAGPQGGDHRGRRTRPGAILSATEELVREP